jgi:hypothetical protein
VKPADAAAVPGGPPAPGARSGLAEAEAIPWRRRAGERSLRRDGRRWTLWSAGVVLTFGAPAAALVALEPLAAPAAAFFLAHGAAVLHIQAGRGARAVVPIGSERSAARTQDGPGHEAEEPSPDAVALGLLADLVGHEERELLRRTGLALHRGELGAWLVGEEGALMVRPGGRRVDCWCVRVSEPGELPAGDRVAHLLLALREDERGFATVANFNFSGAPWRVRLRMPRAARPALARAREIAREMR